MTRRRTYASATLRCPRCDADAVAGRGYDDAGRTAAEPDHCWPPEGETELGACDACGACDWYPDELARLAAELLSVEVAR